MSSNIFRGKTVEEAISSGLNHLGVTEDEVIIEILNEGRKGILKIGTKEAEVRIIKKPASEAPIEDGTHTFQNTDIKKEDLFENKEAGKGQVWVENGKIKCIDPDEGELLIRIPPTLLVKKNGELVKGETTILEKDEISVESNNDETLTKWVIEQSADQLEAKIKVEPGYRLIYSLKDKKPAKEITLETIETKQQNLTLTAQDVHEKLTQLGIVFGVLEEQITAACKAKQKAVFVIAKGIKPVEGKNGWLEYKVEINEGKRFKEREDGSIDYREGRAIPSVDIGTLIAVIHDPEEGEEGKAITGNAIPPKPVVPIQVNFGQGASFQENNTKAIVALSKGRPSIEKRGTSVIVDVVPKLDHQGDVSLSTGNLKFHGDITVSGNIEEHMTVTASGNIEIRGTISRAKINAGQSVLLYSNVISSEVRAGNSNRIIAEKTKKLSEIYEQLVSMQNDLIQISHNPSFAHIDLQKGIMPLIKVLIQTKHAQLIQDIRLFMADVKENIEVLSGAWQSLVNDLYQIFIMMDPTKLKAVHDFEQFVQTVGQLIEASTVQPEHGVEVVLPSAMNSEIYSSGDVIINKQGCYNSNIHAEGTVEVQGFVRGGRVFAGQGADIEEAGSKGGTPTLIIVPDDQIIKIKSALADTTIQIGKKKYTFTKDMTHIVARIDETGTIVIH